MEIYIHIYQIELDLIDRLRVFHSTAGNLDGNFINPKFYLQ